MNKGSGKSQKRPQARKLTGVRCCEEMKWANGRGKHGAVADGFSKEGS